MRRFPAGAHELRACGGHGRGLFAENALACRYRRQDLNFVQPLGRRQDDGVKVQSRLASGR